MRTLSVARVLVPADREADYLAAIRELAALAAQRRQHIWVFRSTREPGVFLEFNESPSRLSHRNTASRTPDELRLEQRLHALVRYDDASAELWEEVPLEVPTGDES